MIIKISDRTPAQLEGLERFFNSQNWVGIPNGSDLFTYGGNPPSEEDKRSVEHPFARLIRKTRDTRQADGERYNITLEISPYICGMGGCNIKVPLSFLAGLMQALDLFSEKFESINLELV